MAVPSAHRWHRLGVSCVQQREPWPDCPIPLRAPPRVPDPDPPGLHDRAPRWRKKLLKDSYNWCSKDVRRVTCGGLATALATVPSNSACLFNLAAPAPPSNSSSPPHLRARDSAYLTPRLSVRDMTRLAAAPDCGAQTTRTCVRMSDGAATVELTRHLRSAPGDHGSPSVPILAMGSPPLQDVTTRARLGGPSFFAAARG